MNSSDRIIGYGLKTDFLDFGSFKSVYFFVFLLAVFACGSELCSSAQTNGRDHRNSDSSLSGSSEEDHDSADNSRDGPPPSSVPTSEIPEPLQGYNRYYRLEYVLDGDSLLLENDEELRLVGIDAPEKDQEFGNRARAFVQSLLKEGALLSVDYDQVVRDRYGRLLGYVWVLVPQENGKKKMLMVNELLLRKGLATIFLHRRNTMWKNRLVTAQRIALRKRKNLFHQLQETGDRYYSVKGHYRYHRPGCGYVREVPDKSIRVFQSREQALRQGCNSADCCLP